jgi:hypothetical protein
LDKQKPSHKKLSFPHLNNQKIFIIQNDIAESREAMAQVPIRIGDEELGSLLLYLTRRE